MRPLPRYHVSSPMLIASIEDSLDISPLALLRGVRWVSPRAPDDILKVFMYRPVEFGRPFCVLAQALMRGKSEWSIGDRELLGAFVSTLNQCHY